MHVLFFVSFFFFNDTATTEIYTLSLHDALPIFQGEAEQEQKHHIAQQMAGAAMQKDGSEGLQGLPAGAILIADRKSTRLNSSHANISYAVFCLKKKKKKEITTDETETSTYTRLQ